MPQEPDDAETERSTEDVALILQEQLRDIAERIGLPAPLIHHDEAL